MENPIELKKCSNCEKRLKSIFFLCLFTNFEKNVIHALQAKSLNELHTN